MTEETANDLKLRVAMHNAARKPGDSIMTDSGMIIGPGDVAQIIDEPDYERSLEISAEIFGGDKELYRTCGMTQEAWTALGTIVPDPEIQRAFEESGWAAKVDEFLADTSAGVTRERPARRTAEILPVETDHDPETCVRVIGDCVDCSAVHIARILGKAEKIIDGAVGHEVPFGDMPPMIDAARAYMELADRHL